MCTGHRSSVPCSTSVLGGRRTFLKAAGAAVGLLATGGLGSAAAGTEPAVPLRRVADDAISYQLFTASSQMNADTAGTLRALAATGLTKVEHAGYAGNSRDAFSRALDDAGLTASSGHTGVPFPYDDARWRATVADAAALGQKAIVEPMPSFARGVAGVSVPDAVWRTFAATLNKAGAVARASGISLGYHNHDGEFAAVAGSLTAANGYEILLRETDPALVHFEMDLYWVAFAGEEPAEWLRAYPERFHRFHVKDMAADGSITAPGAGVLDFTRIFAAAADAGAMIEEYIVEQDNARGAALQTAQQGVDLLRTIRF